MSRSICLPVLLLLTCTALSAPAPKPFESGWGDPVDPDKDCKIRRDSASLTIEIPGSDHDYDPIRKRFNAPRLVRDMEGEFEIQVRVRIACRPSSKSTVKGQPSFVSAGFLLIYPEPYRSVCDRVEYGVMQQGIGLDKFAIKPLLVSPQLERARKGIGEDGYTATKSFFSKKRNDKDIWDRECLAQVHLIYDSGWTDWPLPKKADYVFLKLKYLKGGGFYDFISPDGRKWSEPGSHFGGMPAKVKLALAAFSTASEPSKVCFDRLKITRGEKKSK